MKADQMCYSEFACHGKVRDSAFVKQNASTATLPITAYWLYAESPFRGLMSRIAVAGVLATYGAGILRSCGKVG